MNVTIISSLITAGTALASEYIRHRHIKPEPVSHAGLEKLLEAHNKQVVEVVDQASGGESVNIQVSEVRNPTKVAVFGVDKIVPDSQGEALPIVPIDNPPVNKATSIATGCIPCSLGHVGTCTGLINESVRFARADGVGSVEVIDRVNMCLDELNSMERVDMRPEMIVQLPEWERSIANDVLDASRKLRHELENVDNLGRLEDIAATADAKRKEIGRRWFQGKLSNLSDQDKANIQQRIMDKLSAMQEQNKEQSQ